MSGEVVAVTRMGPDSMDIIRQLTREAVALALGRAKGRIEQLQASDASQVPIDTGLLRSSFMISFTPAHIAMKWSALSPTGFDYARVQDEGRPGMWGWGYSDVMKMQARDIVLEELVLALREQLAAAL